jgi:hypothetical protein
MLVVKGGSAVTSRDLQLVAALAALLASGSLGSGCKDEHDTHVHGHSHGDGGHEQPVGLPSGASCPSDAGLLTYEEFGRSFMEAYCTRCHSSTLTGDARMGATLDHDFDTLDGILLVADHIDQLAAAGPDRVNMMMPPNGTTPTLEEREKLGQWLACELDAM